MSYALISNVIVYTITILGIGLIQLVLKFRNNDQVAKTYAGFVISILFWTLMYHFGASVAIYHHSLLFFRLATIGVLLFLVSYIHFLRHFLNKISFLRILEIFLIFYSIALAYCVVFTNKILYGVQQQK